MPEHPSTTAEDLTFPCAQELIRGHLVRSTTGTGSGAIVLIPDVHGLSDLYRELAARFAACGLTTLAIDLYSREGAPRLRNPEEALRWIAGLADSRVLGDLRGAVDWLAGPGGFDRIGITGFCMGGQYALLGACTLPGISASVSFYGMLRYPQYNDRKPRSPLDAAKDLTCPYLGLFGEEDALIPADDVADLRRRLDAAGKTFEIQTYAGCGHAFLNRTRPEAFRPQAAEDAFKRAVVFFQQHLSRPRS